MPDIRLFDGRDLRRVLGTFVTGVTVVTTTDDEGRFHGVTANSFSSVSLDPPLVLWSQAVKTHSHPVFFKAERFAVNILAEDQIELSKRFARSSQEKFAGIDVDIGSGGVPLLRGCSARLQCQVVSRVPGGDHTIYVGEVHAIDRAEQMPLLRWFSATADICWLIPTIWSTLDNRRIASKLNSPLCGSARGRSSVSSANSTRRWRSPSGALTVQRSPIGSRRQLL